MAVLEKRLEVTVLDSTGGDLSEGSDLVTRLCRPDKVLPPKFLYDDRGRELYQRLAAVPECYMPRAAKAVLRAFSGEVARLTGPIDIIEIGADDLVTTRHILDAYRKPGRPQLYIPVTSDQVRTLDIAPGLLRQYPDLTIHGLSGAGGAASAALPPRQAEARLAVCLDNTLGLLTAAQSQAFLKSMRRTLRAGDWFLAGVDLETDPDIIEAAYNDSEGLTAELNLNALHLINRRYDGRIDIGCFAHRARFNEEAQQVEMSLRSLARQMVSIPGLGFQFELLETEVIQTEVSRKFTLSRIDADFVEAGFSFVDAWADAKELYALFLFRAE
ncbi:MAG: L-histidine N(alpha)-methyltransferase [Alphaproteobacteria bacterium]|nr:L-histidine N(alpha)-methyltransferase [Alphaproteobacteria bacterium]